MSSIRSAISLLLSSILALTFIASSSAQVTPGQNVTSIAGTWSTGSGGVSTGLVSFVEESLQTSRNAAAWRTSGDKMRKGGNAAGGDEKDD